MKKMKRAAALALALALALPLGGCGDAGSGTEAEEKESFAGKALTVLYPSGVYAEAARSIATEFEAGTGAYLKVVELPQEQLYEAIAADVEEGGAGQYDVVAMDARWDGALAPRMAELGDRIEDDGSFALAEFIPSVLERCGSWEGGTYGVPFAAAPRLFAYRSDLCPDGLADGWNAYQRQAADLSGSGMYGISLGGSGGRLGEAFTLALRALGGALADAEGEICVDSPEGLAALESLRALDAGGALPADWLETDADEAVRRFIDGGAAVCQVQPSLGLMLAADDPARSRIVGNWALSLPPTEPGGAVELEAWSLAIPASSDKQALAWEWVKIFTLKENQTRFYEEYGILPPCASFWERDGIAGTALDTVRQAIDSAATPWRAPAAARADALLDTELRRFLRDGQDAETTLSRMDSALREIK